MTVLSLLLITATAFAATGEESYRRLCQGCHGAQGVGGRGPALAVARLARAVDVNGLKSIVRSGLPGTEMPATPGSRLSDSDLEAMVQWIWSLKKPESIQAAEAVSRGREIFNGNGNCKRCHSGGIGPDLSDIGARRLRDSLKESILQPEARIADSFINYRWYIDLPDNFLLVRLVTKQEKAITGARINEDSFSIQVRDMDGAIHSFAKSELSELHKDWGKSPMPAYGDKLTAAEIEDVVTYLSALKDRR